MTFADLVPVMMPTKLGAFASAVVLPVESFVSLVTELASARRYTPTPDLRAPLVVHGPCGDVEIRVDPNLPTGAVVPLMTGVVRECRTCGAPKHHVRCDYCGGTA